MTNYDKSNLTFPYIGTKYKVKVKLNFFLVMEDVPRKSAAQ